MFNQTVVKLKTLTNKNLKCVDRFFYLGLWIKSHKEDKETRIEKAWTTLKKMEVIWYFT